jgi:hypothetical protein
VKHYRKAKQNDEARGWNLNYKLSPPEFFRVLAEIIPKGKNGKMEDKPVK